MNALVVLHHVVVSPVCCCGPILAPEYIIPTTASLLPIFHCETNPPTAAPSGRPACPPPASRYHNPCSATGNTVDIAQCYNRYAVVQVRVCLSNHARQAAVGAGGGLKRQQAGRRTDSSQSAVWVNTAPPQPEIQKTRHESCVTAGR